MLYGKWDSTGCLREVRFSEFLTVRAFASYVRQLEGVANELINPEVSTANEAHSDFVAAALNGQPSRELRQTVPLTDLREAGAFFTNPGLADRLVGPIIDSVKQGATTADPACGVGDLLLACARRLPVSEDLGETLTSWGQKLEGKDLYPQFVRATKLRLLLLAVSRGATAHSSAPNINDTFPGIRVGDSLKVRSLVPSTTFLLLNPPYTKVQAPAGCAWGSGSISQAAMFVERCAQRGSPGTKMRAILPDVLRAGSNYKKWRHRMEDFASIDSVEFGGRFDALTDVDVFMAELTLGRPHEGGGTDWWEAAPFRLAPQGTVGDRFDVRVGPVVPHRDPLRGASYPYLHARGLPSWTSMAAGPELRRFPGTTFLPPFVVVRRTSRPGDKHRATATIITGDRPVAVENHLIVLKPKQNSLQDCDRLLHSLRLQETNDWLNERIRCRHLTVGALRSLPWWER